MTRLTFHENYRLDVIAHAQAANNATLSGPWLSVGDYDKLLFLIDVGDTDTTVDASVEQAKDAAGTDAKEVPGASITQITQSNRIASIEVDARALDVANGYAFARLNITVGNGVSGANVAAFAIRYPAHWAPTTQPDEYAEQVVVTR